MKKVMAVFLAGILILGQSFSALEVRAQESTEEGRKDKTETVYVKADAEGSVQDISVETVLRNRNNGEDIPDYSTLSDIKNMEGDEVFTQNYKRKSLWENNGDNISYKGKGDQELPVSVKISYYLDGKQAAPEEIAGKSGSVRIRFDYENHTSEKVTVAGKTVDVQTPFVLLSVMFLPSDTFSNIKVTNGKVMTSGDDNIVLGYASPGLADSLKLESYGPTEDISIPDYVEVTADASEFELGFTATIVTPGVFADMDTENLDDVPELSVDASGIGEVVADMTAKMKILETYSENLSGVAGQISSMAAALENLKSSVGQLASGSKQLTEGIAAFNDGISRLYEGASALRRGASKLTTAGESLNTGFGTLTQGAQALQEGVSAFDEEGIQSLGDLAGSDLENLLTRIRALKEADSRYNNFAGIRENQTGSVKFIIETEEIEK